MRVHFLALIAALLPAFPVCASDLTEQTRAIAELQRRYCHLTRDRKLPFSPVVKVYFHSYAHDDDLLPLRHLRNLTAVECFQCNDITESGFEEITKLENLTSLKFSGRQLTDAGFRKIKALTNLTDLDISFGSITDAGIAEVGALKKLTNLRIAYNDNFTGTGLAGLTKLKNLRSLRIHVCRRLSDDGMRVIGGLSSLTSLDAGLPEGVTDSGWGALPRLKELTHVSLSINPRITAGGLSQLARLRNLTSLSLGGPEPIENALSKDVDGGLKVLSECQGLTKLRLASRCLTDDDLKQLSKLEYLTELGLERCYSITDAGLAELANFANLHSLRLDNCDRITDAGFNEISRIKKLKYLRIVRCRMLKWDELRALDDLDELSTLSVRGITINDSSLKQLEEFRNLKRLDLECGWRTSDAAIRSLEKALPVTKITLRLLDKHLGFRDVLGSREEDEDEWDWQ